MKAKPIQIVIIAVGVVAAVATAAYTLTRGSGVKLATSLTLVDIETGQLYRVSTANQTIIEPSSHPETGKFSLVRTHKNDSGKWVVSERTLSLLDSLPASPDAIDLDSGEVLSPSDSITDYRFR